MSYPPHIRRRRKSPYDSQVLGVAVRRAEHSQPARVAPAPTLTEPRVKLMRAIAKGEVKRGLQGYRNDWRWHGTTVTGRVEQLTACEWVQIIDGHPVLSLAGEAVLEAVK